MKSPHNHLLIALISLFLVYTSAFAQSAPEITSSLSAAVDLGDAIDYTITASGSPDSFAAFGMHNGGTVNSSTGVISWTPTMEGTYGIIIEASNSFGTATEQLTVVVTARPPEIPTTSATFTAFANISHQIETTNDASIFGVQGLPAELSFDSETATVSGTLTPGVYTFTFSAANDYGTTSEEITLTAKERMADPGTFDASRSGFNLKPADHPALVFGLMYGREIAFYDLQRRQADWSNYRTIDTSTDSVALVDMNRDGVGDLLALYSNDTVQVRWGSTTYASATSVNPPVKGAKYIGYGDVNGDGFVDVLFVKKPKKKKRKKKKKTKAAKQTIFAALNNQEGSFTKKSLVWRRRMSDTITSAVVIKNSEGVANLVVMSNDNKTTQSYIKSGKNKKLFKKATDDFTAELENSVVTVADTDDDGKGELIIREFRDFEDSYFMVKTDGTEILSYPFLGYESLDGLPFSSR